MITNQLFILVIYQMAHTESAKIGYFQYEI